MHSDANDFNSLDLHEVIYATLPCGLVFAIDMTSPQMGWKHAIMPCEDYATRHIHQTRAADLLSPRPAGADLVMAAINGGARLGQELRQTLVETVVHGLCKQLDFERLDANMRKILLLKEADFVVARDAIVGTANRGLSHLVPQIENGARLTLAYDQAALRGFDPAEEWQLKMACGLVSVHFCTRTDLARGRGDMQKVNRIVAAWWRKVLALGKIPGVDVKWEE
jgi:hypothetical protein